MGDEGKLYNGMTELNVQIMRKLTAHADILIPNYTEACYLVEGICSKNNLTITEAKYLVKQLRILGAKSVVITSSFVNNKNCVIGYDHLNDYFFIIEFDLVDVRFPGTGDIFSSILISDVLNGNCLYEATKHAMEVTRDIILYNKNKDEKFFGVDIEKYINGRKL